uniref:ORF14e n=2 Tax=root TaxID=1 RepID=Q8HA61_9CAUD|nr:ORF14e [Vibrio phage Ch457]
MYRLYKFPSRSRCCKERYTMAIKSSAFGRTELSGKDAARFIVHMNEDKPNPKAQKNIAEGRKLRAAMRAWQAKTN